MAIWVEQSSGISSRGCCDIPLVPVVTDKVNFPLTNGRDVGLRKLMRILAFELSPGSLLGCLRSGSDFLDNGFG